MSILDYFHGTPRPQQIEALEQVEAHWQDTDIFVIRAPTGTGKSRIAHCISKWCGKPATILTPNNMLVSQYNETLPDLHTINTKHSYATPEQYYVARARAKQQTTVVNYTSHLANKTYNPLLIVDEAHNLIPFILGDEGPALWYHHVDMPEHIESTWEILAWLEQLEDIDKYSKTVQRKIHRIKEVLTHHKLLFIPETKYQLYRGKSRKCLYLTPVDVTDKAGAVIWPNSVRKMVFMSATFIEDDIYRLNLENRRVRFIDVTSPIPASQRPVVIHPNISMGYRNRKQSVQQLSEYIMKIAAQHTGRGLVHVTYQTASVMASILKDPRLFYHTSESKAEVFNKWLDSDNGILIACGMQEGIDLADDAARWQIIAKIMYPPLTSPAVQHHLTTSPIWYKWQAIKSILQAAGRICRNPDDYGVTYITDATFPRLLEHNDKLFPDWFKEAIQYETID